VLAGRDDVIVTCEPGTRSGAPAAFFPALATIEVDAAVFAPRHPVSVNPKRFGDEDRYPAAWGAFVHEAAHAAHSVWSFPPALRGTAMAQAADLLEESRAGRAHLGRRPGDRRFLRAAVGALVMPDFEKAPLADRWQAARAAGLILARRDAGILEHGEAEPVARTVGNILGPGLLATLTTVWQAAHTTADDDAAAMEAHARAWCEALGAAPDKPAPEPATSEADASTGTGTGTGTGSGEAQPTPGGDLREAVGEAVASVAVHEAAGAVERAAVEAVAAARARVRTEQAARARQAAEVAERIFAPGARPFNPPGSGWRDPSPAVTGTRPPTPGEKTAAAHLARALRAAAYRERAVTVTASAAPPGRLNMRGALARDAQKAAGATPTALPWVHTQRRHTPTPPLRVGIAVDVSGSMESATAPTASAAWIVARAAALTDPDSRTATIAFKASLTAITAPGRTPQQVTRFTADGGGHSLAETLDALTAALDLTTPGAGRLVVLATDARFTTDQKTAAADRIARLQHAGCALLWLAFTKELRPLAGLAPVILNDPARAIATIAKAATAAIRETC
jgi:hypothetical protein